MKNITCLLLAALFCLTSSSCATIFSGTRDEILFTSEPSGAKIIMDGYVVGKTPIMLDVRRRLGGMWVTYELEGYEPVHQKMTTQFNAVAILNLTGPLWWAVDAATGALVRYAMPSVFIEFEPELPVRSGEEKVE